MTAEDTVIQAEAVSKRYVMGRTELQVLAEVTLCVRRREALAITGPSGAGKSTLLHILGGLDKPSHGRVLFKGRDFYRIPPGQRTRVRGAQIGFVFQSYHLLPELDVLENVTLPALSLRGRARSARQLRTRGMALLDAVGLASRWNHTPMELSGGEQQRAALARALMNEPDVVLADEPTGNLDTATGELVLQHLFALTRERGHTLLLVTHNPEVAAHCDRVLHLVDGRISGTGGP